MKKNIACLAVSTVICCSLLLGCGSQSEYSDDYDVTYETEETAAEADYSGDYDYYSNDAAVGVYSADNKSADMSSAGTDDEVSALEGRKLIKTVSLSLETKSFDELIDDLNSRITELGGYAESMNISGNSYDSVGARYASITARIPSDKLDEFVNDVDTETNITSRSENTEDVTLTYSDVEAHRDSLRTEQERLNELLAEADSIDTIVALESRLTEVRYELESYESRLRTMDNQVEYSTVYLDISEVKEYQPEPIDDPSFVQRLSEGFSQGCQNALEAIQNFTVGFIAFLPMLLVIVIIAAIFGAIIFGLIRLAAALVRKAAGRKPDKKVKKGKNKAENPPTDGQKTEKSDDGDACQW